MTEFGSLNVTGFMYNTLGLNLTADFQNMQLIISWWTDFRLKTSWMDLGHILWLDLCATHCVYTLHLIFKLCSWFSAATADHRYQVWHINQDPILDRHSMVRSPEQNSTLFDLSTDRLAQNTFCSGPRGATAPRGLKFGISHLYDPYFDSMKVLSMDTNFYFFSVNYAWSLGI